MAKLAIWHVESAGMMMGHKKREEI